MWITHNLNDFLPWVVSTFSVNQATQQEKNEHRSCPLRIMSKLWRTKDLLKINLDDRKSTMHRINSDMLIQPWDLPSTPLWNSRRNSFENENISTNISNPLTIYNILRILEDHSSGFFKAKSLYKSLPFDLRNGSRRFQVVACDFRRFRFFFVGSACFSKFLLEICQVE